MKMTKDVITARQLRFGTISNLFDQGMLDVLSAKELLAGPLDPGDESTIVDDSALFGDENALSKIAEQLEDDGVTQIVDKKLEQRASAEMKACEDMKFHFEFSIMDLMSIIGALQLALRHPMFTGPTSQIVRQFIDGAKGLLKDQAAIQELIERGFDQRFDYVDDTKKITIGMFQGIKEQAKNKENFSDHEKDMVLHAIFIAARNAIEFLEGKLNG